MFISFFLSIKLGPQLLGPVFSKSEDSVTLFSVTQHFIMHSKG